MKKHILTFLIFTPIYAIIATLLYSTRGQVDYTNIILQSILVGILTTILTIRILKSGFFENKKKN